MTTFHGYTQQEFVEAVKVHGPLLRYKLINSEEVEYEYYTPVLVQKDYIILLDVQFNDGELIEHTPFRMSYKDLFFDFSWQDGSVCGTENK